MAFAGPSMALKRCAAINGTGRARTPGDTGCLILQTEEEKQKAQLPDTIPLVL